MPQVFEITLTAAERYVEHYAPLMATAEARAVLEEATARAVLLRERSIHGQHMWRIPDLDVVLICKRDTGRNVAVTILPPAAMEGRTFTPGYLEERMAVLRGKQASIAADEARAAERAHDADVAKAARKAAGPAVFQARLVGNTDEAAALKARRDAAADAERVALAEVLVLKQRVALAQAEAATIGSECKNIRHALTSDATTRDLKAALRLALLALHGELPASDAIAGVRAIDPGLCSAEFWRK